jgi:hypothetical protein
MIVGVVVSVCSYDFSLWFLLYFKILIGKSSKIFPFKLWLQKFRFVHFQE